MKIAEVKEKAKSLGINFGKMRKAELVHAIQSAENCTPCYGKSDGNCQYTECCFRDDCLKVR